MQSNLNLGDYFLIARRRWRTVAWIAGLTSVAGVAYLIASGVSYMTTARVLVDPPSRDDPQHNSDVFSRVYTSGERYSIASHVALVSGAYLKQKVAEDLGGIIDPNDSTTLEVGKRAIRLDVKNPDDTDFVVVTGTSTSPQLAKQAVDDLLQHYLDRLREIKLSDLRAAEDKVAAKIKDVSARLDENHRLRQEIEENFGAPAPDKDIEKELIHLSELQSNVEVASSKASSAAANVALLERALREQPVTELGLPNGEADTRLQLEQDKLADLLADRTALLQKYTPANPLVVDVESKIAGLQKAIDVEKDSYRKRSLKFNEQHKSVRYQLQLARADQAAKQSEAASLAASLKEVRARMSRFPAFEVAFSKANAEAVRLEIELKDYQATVSQLRLRQATSFIDARVVDPAPTATPAGPGRFALVSLVLAVALILGAFGAIVTDQLDDTIALHHTTSDLGIPPIGGFLLGWSGSRPGKRYLARGLIDAENGLAKLGLIPASSSRVLAFLSLDMDLEPIFSCLYALAATKSGYQVDIVSMNSVAGASPHNEMLDHVANVLAEAGGVEGEAARVHVSVARTAVTTACPQLEILTGLATDRLAILRELSSTVDRFILLAEAGVDTKTKLRGLLKELAEVGIQPAGIHVVELRDERADVTARAQGWRSYEAFEKP